MISILDLPEEIILCIFDKMVFGVDCFANRNALWPLKLSQTCHSWRAIALSSPVLWTCPPLSKRGIMHAYIDRAQGLPLRLSDRGNLRLHGDLILNFLSSGQPVSTLELTIKNKVALDAFPQVIPILVGHLRHLRLAYAPWVLPTIPAQSCNILETIAPMLEALSLQNFLIPEPPRCDFRRLTSLILSEKTPVDCHVTSFLDLLARAPRLQHLSVHNVSFVEPPEHALPKDVQSLPHLQSMSIVTSHLPTYCGLFQHLRIPSTAKVELHGWAIGNKISHLLEDLTTLLSPRVWRAIHGEMRGEQIHIAGFTRAKPNGELPSLSLRLSLYTHSRQDSHTPEELVEAVLTYLPLAEVQTIRLDNVTPQIFSLLRLPVIERMVLNNRSAESVLHHVDMPTPPKLEILALVKVDLSRTEPVAGAPYAQGATLASNLLNYVDRLRDADVLLRTVVFAQCHQLSEELKRSLLARGLSLVCDLGWLGLRRVVEENGMLVELTAGLEDYTWVTELGRKFIPVT